METILQWGIGFINIVQQIHGPVLDSFFRIITCLGTERFYLLLLPLIFWCVDLRLGARLAVILLLTVYVNFGLKVSYSNLGLLISTQVCNSPTLKDTGCPAAMLNQVLSCGASSRPE